MKPIDYAENWNREHKVGTPVKYWTGKNRVGPGHLSKTISDAFILGGHTAVVMLDGVSGCVALSHVKAMDGAKLEEVAS